MSNTIVVVLAYVLHVTIVDFTIAPDNLQMNNRPCRGVHIDTASMLPITETSLQVANVVDLVLPTYVENQVRITLVNERSWKQAYMSSNRTIRNSDFDR
jgi:hypothetical protein